MDHVDATYPDPSMDDDDSVGFSAGSMGVVLLLAAVPVLLAVTLGLMQRDSAHGLDELVPPTIIKRVQALPQHPAVKALSVPAHFYDARPMLSPVPSPRAAVDAAPVAYGAVRNDAAAAVLVATPVSAVDAVLAVRIDLATAGGAERVYQVGESVEFSVALSQDAYLYCYYRDGADVVARVFPNRFQTDAFVEVDKPLMIPGPEAPFDMIAEQPGVIENVICIAAHQDMSEIAMLTPDLTPMPVDSLDQVVTAFDNSTQSAIYRAGLDIRVDR